MNNIPVILYTTPTCPFCVAAKQLLNQKGIAFEDHDVSVNTELRAEIASKTGHRTVPMIFVKDIFIGGFDNLQALNQSGKLDEMLAS